MRFKGQILTIAVAGMVAAGLAGCRNHMPHALTWPASGDTVYSHPKPPEGGYYGNWDPYAVELRLEPMNDVNPVQTQHVLIASVYDKHGKKLPNRRVEWILSDGSVGDIVEVDESGWRASRGYKVTNDFAVSHTNNFKHVLTRGNSDPSDDIHLEPGDTWCVITSPIEGDTYITAYAPGIYDWGKHKVFAVKHWYDVQWEFPPPATNPTGTSHEFVTHVSQYSDGAPLAGYMVTYRIVDGPAGSFDTGGQVAQVTTDSAGMARVTLTQSVPAEGTNNIEIDIVRPANEACCKPPVHIATGTTSKTWIGPKISCDKTGPSGVLVGEQFSYTISVTNPSQVDATNVVVTDNLPAGVEMISSSPSGNGTWNLGTVAAGSTQTVTITARASRVGTFENCAEVRADQNLTSRCCTTTTATAPALALEKTCTPEITICDTIDYVVTVRNTGDGTATNVTIEDRLPDGIVTMDGQRTVTGSVPQLGPGQSSQMRFQAKAERTGTFENVATASADGGLTAQASCTTRVTQPRLSLAKTGPDQRFIGRTATFEIVVSNEGDAPAVDTTLVDTLPSGSQFVEASDGGANNGGRVTWSLGTIAPGASRRVSVTVNSNVAGDLINRATATARCAEASGEWTVRYQGIAAILLEVIDVEDPIEVGNTETYVITVTNQGSAPDTNIVIECTLPPEQQYVSADGATNPTTEGQTVRFAPLPTLAPKAKATYRVQVRAIGTGDVRFGVKMTSDQLTSPVAETESTHLYE